MQGELDAFVASAIGVPFVPFGRDLKGWDCWGCIYCGARDVLGIDLPSYDERYLAAEARVEIAALIAGELGPWRKIDNPQEMDVALIRIGGALCHVGLIVGPRRMLHVARGVDTCIEDHTGIRWRHRIAGIYRYDR